ncbi:Bug family tripartite tricarboxylate transporter substrate binding protein [Enhydrobacter aerosaccus]|uniref:Bug family tripartite tricarboxylate transporter substrate binding protein n=1 Tax=Enhydrobacter aerosaccus TaxID=225324 RepID=UPI0014836183|nr:tripartite tricarboxylate transporter substrate-binding protein [Enhydrobacter aerosaccus]
MRRTLLAGLGSALAGPALAETYPSRPITLVVPFAAGGPTDLMARIIGERMGKELGQQFIIDNTTGAAGTIAVGKAVRAAPDGYTISIGHLGTHVANGTIYKNLSYDLLTDLLPIARLPSNPMLVVSANAVPAQNLKELVDYLKANPDKVSGGTAGIGSASHLGALAFFAATGARYQLVPYRGTGPAVQDLIANQIQVMVDQSSNSLPHVRAGKIRAYAVTAKDRSAAAPEIPTAAEAGYPMEVAIWHGLWAPKGTPAAIVEKLNAAAVATLQDPAIRSRMEDLGQDVPTPTEMAPAAFAAFQRAEYAKWQKILSDANVKVE